MAELKICLVETYKVPSKSAFHRRKMFHSSIKSATESIENWFRRTEKSISGCEFGDLSEFMLIDKFISCLNDETFGQFAVQSPLNAQQCFGISMAMAFDVSTNSMVETIKKPMLDKSQQAKLVKREEQGEQLLSEIDTSKQKNVNDCESYKFKNNLSKDSPECNKTIRETTNAVKPAIITNKCKKSPKSQNVEQLKEDKGYEIRGPNRVVCLDCGKSYRNTFSCIEHRRLHTDKVHRCHICSKPFVKSKDLNKHMKAHENDGKTFECYLCPRTFLRFGHLQRHFRVIHVDTTTQNIIKEFQCMQCEKTFKTNIGLTSHTKMHQSQGLENSFKCNGCDKVFSRRCLMEKHAIRHSDFRPFVCETCGERFKTKESLTRHMRKHTGECPYKCNICGKMMKWDVSFRNHVRSHTGERPFKCDVCEKTFAQRIYLKKHMMIHRNDRPHVCSLCDKRFVTLFNLNVHMLIHTGQKPYQCNMCNKAFTQAATLRSHTSKWHVSSSDQPVVN